MHILYSCEYISQLRPTVIPYCVKNCVIMPEPYQPHFITPIGGPRCHRGTNSDPSPLSPQRKLRSPNLKYEAIEICEVREPFERKVLIHYRYFGCLWKQDIYTSQQLLRPLCNQSCLLIHRRCCWAPLQARYFTHYSWKGGLEAKTVLDVV